MSHEERVDMLAAMAEARMGRSIDRDMLAKRWWPEQTPAARRRMPTRSHARTAKRTRARLTRCSRRSRDAGHPARARRALHAAGAGRRSVAHAAILPTGRNLHGFDPFRIPSAFAMQDGARQAQRLLDAHMAGRQRAAGTDRARAVGHRQSQDRRRADRRRRCG